MNERTKALVWFTGVISKYQLTDTKCDNLQFNTALHNKLKDTHDLVYVIMYCDEEIKAKYLAKVAELGMQDSIYIFGKYEPTDSAEVVRMKIEYTLKQIFEGHTDITKYVDIDKHRLNLAANYVVNQNIYHLSQFLN